MIIWGSSESGEKVYSILRKQGHNVTCLIDGKQNSEEWTVTLPDGKSVPVILKCQITNLTDHEVVIASSSYQSILDEIAQEYSYLTPVEYT